MADKKAIASGNWSDTSTWDGGTLPLAGDDVYANTFTVTVDGNYTVVSVRNGAAAGIVAGGGFALQSAVTLTANVIASTNGNPCVTANTGVATIVGNLNAGSVSGAHAVTTSGDAGITLQGTVTGGTILGAYGVNHAGSGLATIVGNVQGKTGHGVALNNGPIIVTGNVFGSDNAAAAGGIFYGAPNLVCTVNGNVMGGNGGGSQGITLSTGGSLTVNGNVTGGGVNGVNGVSCSAQNCTITINGVVQGNALVSAATTAYGLNFSGTGGTVTIRDGCIGGWSQGAIITGFDTHVVVNGPILGAPSGGGVGTGLTASPTGSGTLTVNGSITARAGQGAAFSGNGGTITGDISAGSTVGCTLSNGAVGAFNFVGNIYGGSVSNGYGLSVASGTVQLTITGNCTGGNAASAHGVHTSVAAAVTITGNCVGGSASSGCGYSNAAAGASVTVYGDCIGGALPVNYGLLQAGIGGPVTVWGSAIGSAAGGNGVMINTATNVFVQVAVANDYPNDGISVAASGVTGVLPGAVTVDALVDGTGGWQPTNTCRVFMRPAGTNYIESHVENLGVTLTLGETTDYPAPVDVRDGTVYSFGAQTGTLKVPPREAVLMGVPTDNTTGNAPLTPEALLGADTLARLRQCSTVETTGNQLAALGS
jgi:hypothetical protein